MRFRMQVLWVLAALLLSTSLALAAPDAPAAPPRSPAGAAGQTAAALAGVPALCPGGGGDALAPAASQFAANPANPANDVCGQCSDAACQGKGLNSVCGVGFRCIPTGYCGAAAVRLCQCLII